MHFMSKGNTHELLNNVYHGAAQVCLHICAVHTPYTHLFRVTYIDSHTLHTYAAPRYTPLEMTCIFSYPTHTSLGLYTYILTPLHTCVAPQYTSSGTSWVWVCLNTPLRFVVVGVSTTLGQMLHLQHCGCGCVYNICADVASTTCASMGWLRLVGSLKLQISFAKEPYKRDYTLQKRPIILRRLLIIATPYSIGADVDSGGARASPSS